MFNEENSLYHVRVTTTHPNKEVANEFVDFLKKGHVQSFVGNVPGVVSPAYIVWVDPAQTSKAQIEIHYQFENKKAFDDYSASSLAEQIRAQVKPFAEKGVTISRVSGLVRLVG